jgi:caffeoyl-CoA O-methyltransferase
VLIIYLCKKKQVELIHPLAQAYAEKFSSAEPVLLREIAAHTNANHPHADMMSSHVQGQFLEMVSRLVQPMRILEIGTFVGYSALYLVNGLKPNGRLHTIELRSEDANYALSQFKKAGVSDKITLHLGNALDIIPTLQETWDLVFIDADKVGYSAYYQLVLPRLRSGGLIIADNVLFHGQVLEEEIKGKNALAIDAFNRLVSQDASVEKVMLTVRDGLLLIRKK